MAKQKKASFPVSTYISFSNFDFIHCDVWRSFSISSLNGHRFFLIVVDDHSKCTWIYLLKAKSEFKTCLEKFYDMVITQFNTKIKKLRSQNGIEFILTDFYHKYSIVHQTSWVETPNKMG